MAARPGAVAGPGQAPRQIEESVMGRLLFVLLVLVAVVVGVGFYRGWFSFERTRGPEP